MANKPLELTANHEVNGHRPGTNILVTFFSALWRPSGSLHAMFERSVLDDQESDFHVSTWKMKPQAYIWHFWSLERSEICWNKNGGAGTKTVTRMLVGS